MSTTPGPDLAVFHSRLYLFGTLELATALRVGVGRASNATETDLPVVKDVLGRPIIPGSSFKGALRSHVEALLRAAQEHIARQPNEPLLTCLSVSKNQDELPPGYPDQPGSYPGYLTAKMVSTLKDKPAYRENPDRLDQVLRAQSCWTCRVFGAPWLASKVAIKDLLVDETWFERYEIRDGVGIDRDTGRAAPQLKYEFEVVPVGAHFHFEALIDNADDAEMALVLLALRAFEDGRVQLGGARSRGLGWCRLRIAWERCRLVTQADAVDYLLGGEGQPFLEEDRDKRIPAFARATGLQKNQREDEQCTNGS